MPYTRRSHFPLYLVFLYLFVLVCLVLWANRAHATVVTGTVKFQGQPLTGYYDVALSYPGTTGTYLALPGADPSGHTRLTNGQIGPLVLEGNDTLLPRGSYYQFTYYNAYAAPVASLKYVVTGSTFDLGTAVPTPITPANINYLDLLGLRNVSVQNLAVTNQIQIGGGAIYSASGVANAKILMDVRYAAAYASTSTTCGVQEALNSLPATGGTVYLQLGVCVVTSPITITKPARLIGHGRGGGPAVSGILPSSTVLANGMLASPLIKIAAPTLTSTLSGVFLSDFAILGNAAVAGATTGDGVYVLAGTSAAGLVSSVDIDSVLVYGCIGSGLHVSNQAANLHVSRSSFVSNLGSGVLLDTPAGGSLSAATFENTRFSANTLSGLTLAGSGVSTVSVFQSTFASNVVDGVNLVSGSVVAALTLTASTLTDNHNAGLAIADGQGSVVADSTFTPGSHQLYGIYAPLPTIADAFATQLTLRGNRLVGNLTADLYEGATTTYLLFYPQTERLGGTGVVYTLLAPNSIHYIQPSVAVARTCGGSGCYRIETDGTIEQWGTVTGGSGGANAVSVTFPIAFTTTSDLSITNSCVGVANCNAVVTSPTTSGFSFTFAPLVFVGGTGVNLPGQPGYWHAIGH